uniref:Uncharacterized protein n=2 Tax=Picea TaxID=3328 RepID=A0A101M4R6_PICGL|nr:hypothetical protein ABT39_MTgene705 [Picea glauca]QHR90216.1 hypothetical protein Q903MT_gene4239 [Picea sitchensis]
MAYSSHGAPHKAHTEKRVVGYLQRQSSGNRLVVSWSSGNRLAVSCWHTYRNKSDLNQSCWQTYLNLI